MAVPRDFPATDVSGQGGVGVNEAARDFYAYTPRMIDIREI